MGEVLVEDLIAYAHLRCALHAPQVSVVGKLFFEAEHALINLALDHFKALSGSTQVPFRRRAFDRRAVSDAIQDEVKLNPAVRRCADSALEPFAPHVICPAD